MTLVVSIGGAVLGGLGTAATALGATSAGAALAGASTAAAAGGLTGATVGAGLLGSGVVAGGLEGVDKLMQPKVSKTAATGPTLAPELSPAMSASQALAPATAAPMAGLASIGQNKPTGMAHGGQVPVKNGAFIIPADVVSALGNGSSKAGAAFLDRLMEEVKAQGAKRHGLGAVHDRA